MIQHKPFTFILLILFFLPYQLVAQTQNEGFDSLYTNLKINFDNGKYAKALSIPVPKWNPASKSLWSHMRNMLPPRFETWILFWNGYTLNELKTIIAKQQDVKEASFVESETKGFDFLYANTKTPAKFHVGNETLKVHFVDKKLYLINNNPDSNFKSAYIFSSQLPIEFKGKLVVENKYFKIGVQTKVVKFVSSSENVLTIDSEGKFKVKKPGNVIITISVDDDFVKIPLKIINIPIAEGMSRDNVIEILGMPDKVNKKYIGWVESANIDGIFYYANTNDGMGISVEHWIYNKYPNAILRFGYSGLSSCVMASWEKLSTKKYSLEHE